MPLLVTTCVIQLEAPPKRTARVPLTENAAFSEAIFAHVTIVAETWHILTIFGAGSLPKAALLHTPLVTGFVIQPPPLP